MPGAQNDRSRRLKLDIRTAASKVVAMNVYSHLGGNKLVDSFAAAAAPTSLVLVFVL
jgi:hypothetical protein